MKKNNANFSISQMRTLIKSKELELKNMKLHTNCFYDVQNELRNLKISLDNLVNGVRI